MKTPESLISAKQCQLACVDGQGQRGIPLSLYSAGLFSLMLTACEGGRSVFSTCPFAVAGLTFSSCLRNGLRMMGILTRRPRFALLESVELVPTNPARAGWPDGGG